MYPSTKIAAVYMMHKQIQLYKSTIMAVVKIQSIQRRPSGLRHARKLRDPFYCMTFEDLKQLFLSETSRVEEAVAAKDFRTAANLEESQTVSIVTFDRVLTFQTLSHSLCCRRPFIASTVNLPTRQWNHANPSPEHHSRPKSKRLRQDWMMQ